MKTNIILLLSLLLVVNVKLAYSQKIGKARSILSNSQLEQMKQMPPDEAKIFRDSIIRAWADFRVDSIRRQMQKQRELPTGQISETFDWTPTLDRSPFDLNPEQQDSVKKAQRKIIDRYKKTPFTQLDKCEQEIVMIAKAKIIMLTYAPAYYREGSNVAPPLISDKIYDYNDRPYSEICFSYDPEQEVYYNYFFKSYSPDIARYRYCGDPKDGRRVKYLNLYSNVMVEIWTDTGEVKSINDPDRGRAIGTMPKEQRLEEIVFKYATMYIKDDKLREELEAPILKKQKESSE
ncbi:hypothetical protein [Sunxiuqinia indica]|uniref:hypothetical protein n=1 Tax=Sunxiuqinia indica TaxID=2692584 RepID=UPI0013593546|nr:hypothetical protein [Sunxiuqinia indica]